MSTLQPRYAAVWAGHPPIFQKKVRQASDAVTELESFVQQLPSKSPGATNRKQREERELEEIAYLFGGTLAIWFTEQSSAERSSNRHDDLGMA